MPNNTSGLIPRLKRWLSATKIQENADQDEVTDSRDLSIWRDTGQVYYLENTLKITYQSQYGKMTLEQVKLADVVKILKDIQKNEAQYIQQAEVAGQKDAICISVCAVTWQTNGETTRIKAIPEGAMLRSQHANFFRTQAVFKHEFALEHDDLLTSNALIKPGWFTYMGISVEQFLLQIRKSNLAISPAFKRLVSVNAENFAETFTDNEKGQVMPFLLGEYDDISATPGKD
ncbi:MAG: hypothetical protein ABWW63_01130 [Glaciecola sp.]|jgi:hypothetical protein